jgi:hypothetical protein
VFVERQREDSLKASFRYLIISSKCDCINFGIVFIHRLAEFPLKIQIFRRIQIFTEIFNDTVLNIFIPTIVISCAGVICLAIFILVDCVAQGKQISMLPGIVFISPLALAMMTSLLLGASKCWEHSLITLEGMKKYFSVDKILQKQILSLRPFGYRYGPLRAIKYQNVFDHYEAIINNTITLLTFNKH